LNRAKQNRGKQNFGATFYFRVSMDYGGLPLSTLLSQVLVAFTIEFDNEFERRKPHRTTNHGGTPHAPWLVSLAMWSNCMQFIGDDGVRVGELEELARSFALLPRAGRPRKYGGRCSAKSSSRHVLARRRSNGSGIPAGSGQPA